MVDIFVDDVLHVFDQLGHQIDIFFLGDGIGIRIFFDVSSVEPVHLLDGVLREERGGPLSESFDSLLVLLGETGGVVLALADRGDVGVGPSIENGPLGTLVVEPLHQDFLVVTELGVSM